MENRRTRIYHLDMMNVLRMLNRGDRILKNESGVDTVVLCLKSIPVDAKAIAIYPTFDPPGMDVIIEHPSFDEVEAMGYSPRFGRTEIMEFPVRFYVDEQTASGLRDAYRGNP